MLSVNVQRNSTWDYRSLEILSMPVEQICQGTLATWRLEPHGSLSPSGSALPVAPGKVLDSGWQAKTASKLLDVVEK